MGKHIELTPTEIEVVEWLRKWRVEEARRWGEVNLTFQDGSLTYKESKFGEKGKVKTNN